MCGRYNDHLPKMIGWAELLKDWPADFKPSYNRAPSTQVAAFRRAHGELMRWGMIAPWSQSFDSKYATYNARIETVADKPTFRSAWNNLQRCLIPMAGYYEWQGDKGKKQPFYITDRDTGGLVVAGLYESWGENEQLSCTILTCSANDELAPIHPRMPIMLTPQSAQAWMKGDSDGEDLASPNVIYFPVNKAVGNVRNDEAYLTHPIDV